LVPVAALVSRVDLREEVLLLERLQQLLEGWIVVRRRARSVTGTGSLTAGSDWRLLLPQNDNDEQKLAEQQLWLLPPANSYRVCRGVPKLPNAA